MGTRRLGESEPDLLAKQLTTDKPYRGRSPKRQGRARPHRADGKPGVKIRSRDPYEAKDR
jgi:hypothetical protein